MDDRKNSLLVALAVVATVVIIKGLLLVTQVNGVLLSLSFSFENGSDN